MAFPTVSVLNSSASPVTVNTLPNAGQNAKVDSLGVVIASDDDIQAKLGIVTETAPASDTASSGLNGRLQRIAQRLTSLIALLPASLGIKTAANSLSITHASDDAVVAATGTIGDTAWASGNGSLVALLKAIATNAISTTPSPVELGPFSAVYLTSGTNAAVQTTTAAAGDYLQHAVLQPTTTSPGAFTLYDGSTSGTNSIKYTHPGGASSLSNLAPIIVGLSAKCVNAGWHITIVSGWTVTLVGTFS